MDRYEDFLERKSQIGRLDGFDPVWIPDWLFGFQQQLVTWALRKGRAAIFADTGLGKTPMQLVWAENVRRKTDKPVLILTPLAVSWQTAREAEKFGIEAERSPDGKIRDKRIVVANYERLHYFDPNDFGGVVCDESSAIKAFDGRRRAAVTEFLRTIQYRSLWTATAAPNDYVELGTSSEALGELGQTDMLTRFFRNDNNTIDTKGHWKGHGAPHAFVGQQWRFKGHAEEPFWKWVCSWARACRRPSDLGFADDGFILPPLVEREHVVEATEPLPGMLFTMPAANLGEERKERRRTIDQRCELAANLVNDGQKAVIWCHLNDEGDLLSKMIPGSVQVSGSTPDDEREEAYVAFASGDLRVLVIKPRVGAWGMNWQACAHVVTFVSHSYEQYYQSVRRCWRFGQKRSVVVDVIGSEGEVRVKENMKRKAAAADRMFTALVAKMNEAETVKTSKYDKAEQTPGWLRKENA